MPYLSASVGDLLRYHRSNTQSRSMADDANAGDRDRARELETVGIRRADRPRGRSCGRWLDFVVVQDRGFLGNMLRVPSLFPVESIASTASIRNASAR